MSDIQESSKENISELPGRARIIIIIVIIIILQDFKNWQQPAVQQSEGDQSEENTD